MDPDTMMHDANPESHANEHQDIYHFVVAVDFGTTFSSVAFARYMHEHQRENIRLEQVELIGGYPDWEYRNHDVYDVPTELWYPSPGHRIDGTNSFATSQQMQGMQESDSDDSDNEESDLDSNSDASAKRRQRRQLPPMQTGSSVTPKLYWGYGVRRQVKYADAFDSSKRIARFKLLLDDSPASEKVRITLGATCDDLRKMGVLTPKSESESETEPRQNTEIIAHYLENLFVHTHEKLIEEGYTKDSNVEFALCVPVAWKARACRQMHEAMSRAIHKAGFGTLRNGKISNLFIVAEPEAAATAAVASDKLKLNVRRRVHPLFVE